MKRLFDIVSSLAALICLSWLLIPIIIALRLTGEGEVFYRQERVGKGGKLFGILKFATMLKNSPNMSGGDITVGNDPRILPLGHFLRKTKINELPQLINILVGDMSVIGPRPLTPRVAAMFTPEHWAALAHVRPGLSGIGSIVFRDEETLLANISDRQRVYADVIVPYKMALEHWYADHQSFFLDIELIVLTVLAVAGVRAEKFLRGLPPEPANLTALRTA